MLDAGNIVGWDIDAPTALPRALLAGLATHGTHPVNQAPVNIQPQASFKTECRPSCQPSGQCFSTASLVIALGEIWGIVHPQRRRVLFCTEFHRAACFCSRRKVDMTCLFLVADVASLSAYRSWR